MIFSHDTETDLVQAGIAAPPLVCSSIADDLGVGILDESQSIPWFRERLERGDSLVGLNYAFDLGVCCAADPRLVRPVFTALEQKRVFDVGIREALIDIARGNLIEAGEDEMGIRYGMRELSKRYFNEDVTDEKKGDDSWRRRFALLRGIPIEKWPWRARRYVLRDAAKPLEIFRLQQGQPNLHDEFRQVRAAFAFQLMSMWGLRTNRPKVTALETEVEDEWQKTRTELMGAGIFRPDKKKGFVQDKKRTAELVQRAYGDATPFTAPSSKFPKGQVATDRDTLLESGDPILVKLGSAGKNDKRRSTYLPILREGLDVPWNPQFNVLVATGRASGDAQQFPTGKRSKGGIREAFEPREGYCYCSVDYSGLELRTAAQIALWEIGYSYMAEVLNRGDCPHLMVAATFMGSTYAQLVPRRAVKDPVVEIFRDSGKISNFGFLGGMGAGAQTYNAREKDDIRFCITTGAAKPGECGRSTRLVKVRGKQKRVCAHCFEIVSRFRRGWLDTWIEQKERFRRASLATDGNQRVEVTVPMSKRRRGLCGYSQLLNTPFQGLGGDLAKDATWRVAREMHTDSGSPLWGSHLVLMVHDELIAELPIDRAPEAAERIAEVMKQTAREWLPDLGPSIEAEPAISLTMSKSMATVRDASGRLELWAPKIAA